MGKIGVSPAVLKTNIMTAVSQLYYSIAIENVLGMGKFQDFQISGLLKIESWWDDLLAD
jgi:hypothetical protein